MPCCAGSSRGSAPGPPYDCARVGYRSGRTGSPRKRVRVHALRGFKSHPHRYLMSRPIVDGCLAGVATEAACQSRRPAAVQAARGALLHLALDDFLRPAHA
ncbi:MAG: hypothetical protein QOG21_1111 [Actinomycetota bacterium]|nr:hypothetical protein [Actinomycetota bacterium]